MLGIEQVLQTWTVQNSVEEDRALLKKNNKHRINFFVRQKPNKTFLNVKLTPWN